MLDVSVGLADAPELDRVLATDFAPDVLDEAPFPTELPDTVTLGLEIEDDCEPDVLVALLADPDVDVCATAVPLNTANAVAARSIRRTKILLTDVLRPDNVPDEYSGNDVS